MFVSYGPDLVILDLGLPDSVGQRSIRQSIDPISCRPAPPGLGKIGPLDLV